MKLRDGVAPGGELHGEHGHVKDRSPLFLFAAEVQQPFVVGAEPRGPAGGELVEKVRGEGVVAGRDRGVGGKYRAPGDLLAGVVEGGSSGDQLADTFEA